MQCFQLASPQAARERQSKKCLLPGVAHGEKLLQFGVGVRHRLLSKTGETRHVFHRIVELHLRLTKQENYGGRACKPDSVPHANRKRPAYAAIIPLGHDSHRDSSTLPEGSHPRWLAPPQKERVHSHERSLIEPGRLSPPIWPCTARGFPCPRCCHRSGGLLPHLFTLAKRCEHFEDVSQVSLCDATALHSAGGLFSVALSVALRVAQALACAPQCAPWRYQARRPVKSSANHLAFAKNDARKMISVPQDGVRTILPPSHLAMTKPAITRPARQFHYTSTISRVVTAKYPEYFASNRGFWICDRRCRFWSIFCSRGPIAEEHISE